jgi:hypothetical protein
MPYIEGSGGYPKRLHSSNCPPGLSSLFERWARMVPFIQLLPRDQKTDLQRIICNKSPSTAPPRPPPYLVSQNHSNFASFYMLADDLRGVASDIVHCLRRQPEYSYAPATPNMGPITMSPAWLAPSLAPSPTSYTAPPASPRFNYRESLYQPPEAQRSPAHDQHTNPPNIHLPSTSFHSTMSPIRPAPSPTSYNATLPPIGFRYPENYQPPEAQRSPIRDQAQYAYRPNILTSPSSIQSSPTYMPSPSPMTSPNPMNMPVDFVGGFNPGGLVATTGPNPHFPAPQHFTDNPAPPPPPIQNQFVYNTTPMPASSYLPASNPTEVIGSRMVRRFDLVLPYFSYLSHNSQLQRLSITLFVMVVGTLAEY